GAQAVAATLSQVFYRNTRPRRTRASHAVLTKLAFAVLYVLIWIISANGVGLLRSACVMNLVSRRTSREWRVQRASAFGLRGGDDGGGACFSDAQRSRCCLRVSLQRRRGPTSRGTASASSHMISS